MSVIALHRLLHDGYPDEHIVASRNDAPILFGRFRADVGGVAAHYRHHAQVALVCRDSYLFAVGLFGLLHAQVRVILPPHDRSEVGFERVDDKDVEDAVAGIKGIGELNLIDPDALSIVFHTSGSTGAPKPIAKSLSMFAREIAVIENVWGGNAARSEVMATVPHHHVYGMTFRLLWPLMTGRILTAETHEVWETVIAAMHRDSVIITSPAHLERLGGLTLPPDLQRPARIFSAGAPLSYAASSNAEKIFGGRPTEIFGSSETGAFATRVQNSADEAWQLLPGIELNPGANKRASLRSPFIGNDWLPLEDIVERHSDGFRFCGRADHIVKIEGKRVHLRDVEACLTHLPFVVGAAAVVIAGAPDRLAAAVVLSDDGRRLCAEKGDFRFGRFLRGELLAKHEGAAVPRLWRFVEALPQKAMGKRSDADIRALFGAAS